MSIRVRGFHRVFLAIRAICFASFVVLSLGHVSAMSHQDVLACPGHAEMDATSQDREVKDAEDPEDVKDAEDLLHFR